MNAGIIAMRYARALLAYTERQKVSDEVYREMDELARHFALEPRLRRVLANPILAQSDKVDLLKTAVGEKITPETENFIRLVVRKHRELLLQDMALGYLKMYRKARNIKQAYVETAVALPEKTRDRLREMIEKRTKSHVELITTVKPELIGGFVFDMNFRRIDGSVRTQLNDIKKHFVDENRRTI